MKVGVSLTKTRALRIKLHLDSRPEHHSQIDIEGAYKMSDRELKREISFASGRLAQHVYEHFGEQHDEINVLRAAMDGLNELRNTEAYQTWRTAPSTHLWVPNHKIKGHKDV